MQENIPEIELQVTRQEMISWHRLLREGVDVQIKAGRSVQELLQDELIIDEDTIQEQIKTIFLNQKPVDDLQTAVPDQSTLTLSGAMPGFLGACMRVGSPYARMRESISETGESGTQDNPSGSTATVRLKVFNILVPQIAPNVLQRGILLSRERFQEHLKNLPQDFLKSCQRIEVNQNPCPADISSILERLQDSEHLRIFIHSED